MITQFDESALPGEVRAALVRAAEWIAERFAGRRIQPQPRVAALPTPELGEGEQLYAVLVAPGGAALQRIEAGRAAHGRRFLLSYYGATRGGRSLDRPLGTVTTKERWALVDGDRLRMLSVDEYRAAMGFPAHYRLPGSKAEQVKLLGNAVCPPMAAAVVRQLAEAVQ